MTTHEILDRFDNVRRTGERQIMCCCPSHDDRRPSLSVKAVEGKTLLYCFAGCTAEEIVEAVGLKLRDLYDNT